MLHVKNNELKSLKLFNIIKLLEKRK